jgi:hypothetical protein
MSTIAVTTVFEARATANGWLIEHLPDRFAAGIPAFDADLSGWRIPVWLSYPRLEPLGPVGELVIDEVSGDVKSYTPIDEMNKLALELYAQHREQIEAPFL